MLKRDSPAYWSSHLCGGTSVILQKKVLVEFVKLKSYAIFYLGRYQARYSFKLCVQSSPAAARMLPANGWQFLLNIHCRVPFDNWAVLLFPSVAGGSEFSQMIKIPALVVIMLSRVPPDIITTLFVAADTPANWKCSVLPFVRRHFCGNSVQVTANWWHCSWPHRAMACCQRFYYAAPSHSGSATFPPPTPLHEPGDQHTGQLWRIRPITPLSVSTRILRRAAWSLKQSTLNCAACSPPAGQI